MLDQKQPALPDLIRQQVEVRMPEILASNLQHLAASLVMLQAHHAFGQIRTRLVGLQHAVAVERIHPPTIDQIYQIYDMIITSALTCLLIHHSRSWNILTKYSLNTILFNTSYAMHFYCITCPGLCTTRPSRTASYQLSSVNVDMFSQTTCLL